MNAPPEPAPINTALQAVRRAEAEGALFSQEVLGYPVWPLERLRRYRMELLDGKLVESTGPNAPLTRRLRSLTRPFEQSLRDVRELDLGDALRSRDLWVLGTSNYRRVDSQGIAQCIFAEDLRAQLGERLLFLERTTNDLVLPPRPDVVHLDALHVAAMMSAKALGPLLARGGAINAEQRRAFAPASAAYICQLALYGQTMQRFAAGLIEKHRPAAVFVLCGYQPFIPIQRAIKRAGIPLIELQHGVIHESHPGYALGQGARCDHLPDVLVVFGQRFARIAEAASPYWRGRLRIGGHPWLREKSRVLPPLQARNTIVFFSQTDVPVREALRALAAALPRALHARGLHDVRVLIKPHPREVDAAQYWGGLREHGVALAPVHADSYALLRECRVAVSVHSTVAIEAPAFGCTSAVTHRPLWTEDIRTLVEQGGLLEVGSADEIATAFERGSSEPDALRALANDLFAVSAPPLDYRALLAELGG